MASWRQQVFVSSTGVCLLLIGSSHEGFLRFYNHTNTPNHAPNQGSSTNVRQLLVDPLLITASMYYVASSHDATISIIPPCQLVFALAFDCSDFYTIPSAVSMTGSMIVMGSGIYSVDQVLFTFIRKTTSPIIDCVLKRPLPTADSMAKMVLL